MRTLLLLASLLAVSATSAEPFDSDASTADFYVATDGDDAWSGVLPEPQHGGTVSYEACPGETPVFNSDVAIGGAVAADGRPNVVLIITDDQGYGDLSRPGNAVPAVKASVRIGEAAAEAPVEPGAKEVVLQMILPAGKARMPALFTTRDGAAVGAFYAYVKKR